MSRCCALITFIFFRFFLTSNMGKLGRNNFCLVVLRYQLQKAAIRRSILFFCPLHEQPVIIFPIFKRFTIYIVIFILQMCVHYSHSEMNSNGVQVLVSAFGIHFRFIGVSSVTGKILATKDSAGSPPPSAANDLVSW